MIPVGGHDPIVRECVYRQQYEASAASVNDLLTRSSLAHLQKSGQIRYAVTTMNGLSTGIRDATGGPAFFLSRRTRWPASHSGRLRSIAVSRSAR